jgi:type II secretion system protein N
MAASSLGTTVSGFAGQLGRLLPRRVPAPSTFGYAIWAAAWFVLFLALTFPHDLIVRHWSDEIAAQSGWQLRYDDVWLRPWNGYHVSRARVVAPGKDPEPVLAAAEVVFRPSFSVLFGGSPFPFYFSGHAYGGDFVGSVAQTGALDLSWTALRLGDYPRITSLVDGNWAGELSGELHLSGSGDLKTLEGRGRLGVKNASLTQGKAQGFTIPDLHFASGDADFEMKAGRVEVRSLKLSGSEVDAELHGQLYLLSTNAMPVVNAALTLKPIPGAPPGLEALLTLLNRNQKPPSGAYSFTLYGPLNSLRVR